MLTPSTLKWTCPALCYTGHGILSNQITGVGSVSLLQGSSQRRYPALPVDSLPAKPQRKPVYIDSRIFRLAKLKLCICWTSLYFSSLPTLKPLATTNTLSASISLMIHPDPLFCFNPWTSLRHSLAQMSLVVQRIRIHLPIEHGFNPWSRNIPHATEQLSPCMSHNYRVQTLEPSSHNYWADVLQLLKPACLEPTLHYRRSHHNEKPMHSNEE